MFFQLFVFLLMGFVYPRSELNFIAQKVLRPSHKKHFEISILHINDFHAHFVERTGSIGGLPRIVTALRELLNQRPNPIFLNAGDSYTGTLWYNVYRWNATAHFLNRLSHDAMTLGNHDFDDYVSGLIPFLRRIESPIVVTNIDDSEEPLIQGLFKNSKVIEKAGKKIGVIGVILQDTNSFSKTGNLKFLDEVTEVIAESRRLKAQGIDIIIVLSHCGLKMDKIIAMKCPDIDVIVGGHSHTFLYNGNPPNQDIPEDKYPIVMTQQTSNRTVLIVQAAAYTRYLGNLTVWFDEQGEVVDWEGNPIVLDTSIKQDEETLKELESWSQPVNEMSNTIVGETKSYLNNSCHYSECILANLITDAMVHAWSAIQKSAISCMNADGIKSDIDVGKITYNDLMSMQPYGSSWDLVNLLGRDLKTVLEESVLNKDQPNRFFHWSGIKVVYNMSRPVYDRIIDLHVRSHNRSTMAYYEKLFEDNLYSVVVPSMFLSPDDRLPTLKKKHSHRIPGGKDIELLADYLKFISPFKYDFDNRLTFVN